MVKVFHVCKYSMRYMEYVVKRIARIAHAILSVCSQYVVAVCLLPFGEKKKRKSAFYSKRKKSSLCS